ncbi:MAG: dihydroorotate dehydrogenase electron transfer subunit [Clostridia bacterium]
MKQINLKVKENNKISKDIYKLILVGDIDKTQCGQFIEIALNGFYLRRPFGIADRNGNEITVLYRVSGRGTEAMIGLKNGDELDCLVALGNGFRTERSKKPLLVGGGIGIAPLYYLAKELVKQGKKPVIVLGFKNEAEAFYVDEFKKLGSVIVSSDDGSIGFYGNAVEALMTVQIDYDYYYACGPTVMLKALSEFSKTGELSLEARMACGFGACMGCSIETYNGIKRVCKDGPIFDSAEVKF